MHKVGEPLPGEMLALAPMAKPFVPGSPRRLDEQQQAAEVAAAAEVVEVASQASRERSVLCLDRMVSMATTPIVDGLNRPSQARTPSLTTPSPTMLPGTGPIEREPKEIEGRRTSTALLPRRRAPKRQKPRLVRVQGQPEAPQPLAKHRHHTLGIFPPLEADEEVIAAPSLL